ncbi:MAG TPA: hypothetical protein VGM47_06035 [Gammaproteobacteria bacterium]|jgi:hypothetical protein
MDFSELEKKVLDVFLTENDARYPQLRNQIKAASVNSRKFTGVGFFTVIELPPDVPKLPRDSYFFIGLVCAVYEGVVGNPALGFALFVQDGRLKTLEGFTYERGWSPDVDINDFKLSYHRNTGRIIASDSAS